MWKIVKRKAARRLVKIDNRKHANLCKTTASNSRSNRAALLGKGGKMTGTFLEFRLKNESPSGIISPHKGVVGTLCGAVNKLSIRSGRA